MRPKDSVKMFHQRIVEMKTGVVLFRGAPEGGNSPRDAASRTSRRRKTPRARSERRAALPKPGAVSPRRARRRSWAVWKSTSEVGRLKSCTVRAPRGRRRSCSSGPMLSPPGGRDPKSTRPFRYSLQIREQRQRRGCIAQKLAPEAKREAPGPSLRDRLRGLVAGPFEGEGRALE